MLIHASMYIIVALQAHTLVDFGSSLGAKPIGATG